MLSNPVRPRYQAFLTRLLDVCQSDPRISAVFLVGSYARGTADEYSDMDLFLVLEDTNYDNFVAERTAFINQLGDALFVEDFHVPNCALIIFGDGTDVELQFCRESLVSQTLFEPYHLLIDKENISAALSPADRKQDPNEQIETLRSLMAYFWHDMTHFTTAVGRNQLWWAQGELEILRGYCVSLARLENDFYDQDAVNEPFFKVDEVVPDEQLSPLFQTYGSIDRNLLINSAMILFLYYKRFAVPLAQRYGLQYPETLEQVVMSEFNSLSKKGFS